MGRVKAIEKEKEKGNKGISVIRVVKDKVNFVGCIYKTSLEIYLFFAMNLVLSKFWSCVMQFSGISQDIRGNT